MTATTYGALCSKCLQLWTPLHAFEPMDYIRPAEEGKLTMPQTTPIVSVSMTPFDWHRLLTVLDFCQSIKSREAGMALELLEKICTQLHDIPVKPSK